MNLYKQYKTNAQEEKDGIIMDHGDGTKFMVARAGGANKRYSRALRKLTLPHRRAIQTETISDAKAREIQIDAFIAACLRGWEGVSDAEGNKLECTPENAKKLFTDLPDLFDILNEDAAKASLYREASLEEDAKN